MNLGSLGLSTLGNAIKKRLGGGKQQQEQGPDVLDSLIQGIQQNPTPPAAQPGPDIWDTLIPPPDQPQSDPVEGFRGPPNPPQPSAPKPYDKEIQDLLGQFQSALKTMGTAAPTLASPEVNPIEQILGLIQSSGGGSAASVQQGISSPYALASARADAANKGLMANDQAKREGAEATLRYGGSMLGQLLDRQAVLDQVEGRIKQAQIQAASREAVASSRADVQMHTKLAELAGNGQLTPLGISQLYVGMGYDPETAQQIGEEMYSQYLNDPSFKMQIESAKVQATNQKIDNAEVQFRIKQANDSKGVSAQDRLDSLRWLKDNGVAPYANMTEQDLLVRSQGLAPDAAETKARTARLQKDVEWYDKETIAKLNDIASKVKQRQEDIRVRWASLAVSEQNNIRNSVIDAMTQSRIAASEARKMISEINSYAEPTDQEKALKDQLQKQLDGDPESNTPGLSAMEGQYRAMLDAMNSQRVSSGGGSQQRQSGGNQAKASGMAEDFKKAFGTRVEVNGPKGGRNIQGTNTPSKHNTGEAVDLYPGDGYTLEDVFGWAMAKAGPGATVIADGKSYKVLGDGTYSVRDLPKERDQHKNHVHVEWPDGRGPKTSVSSKPGAKAGGSKAPGKFKSGNDMLDTLLGPRKAASKSNASVTQNKQPIATGSKTGAQLFKE